MGTNWGQCWGSVALVSLVLSIAHGENRDMASLEKRGNSYRTIFRHDGWKITRSLQTANRKAAQG